jgi:hypothetical protein
MNKVKTTVAFQTAADAAIAEFLKRGGAVELVKAKAEPKPITAK